MKNGTILVVGATGYVGTRLVQMLLEKGNQVRAVYRTIEKIQNKLWFNHSNLEIVWADVFHLQSLINAAEGCYVAYYLVHCMFPDQDNYQIADRIAAENMVIAANRTSIMNIIYLSGLGGDFPKTSNHLRSRYRVGKILRTSLVPVTILNCGMIIGSGSASFEILRYIVERLPVMITPKWIHTKSQAIAIRNVIEYLYYAMNNSDVIGKTFDIGGPDIFTYRKLMEIYAIEASLRKRIIISLPFNDPLHSTVLVLEKIIPLDRSLLKPLIGSLKVETICKNNEIQGYIQQPLFTVKESIRRAISETRRVLLHDSFQLDGWAPPLEWSYFGDPVWSGGFILFDRWAAILKGDESEIWRCLESIGGENGWYHGDRLWRMRGFFDELVGGDGLKPGRKHPTLLNRGDILDCWQVTQIHRKKSLILTARIKLPGIGSLAFKLKKIRENTVLLDQIASFVPRGLWGILYWKLVLPFHTYIFRGLIHGIARKSNSKIIYGPKYLDRATRI